MVSSDGGAPDSAGDVVVTSAGDILVEDVEDVFVSPRAGYREATVTDAHDVYIQADDADHRDVHRDHVVDDGRDVRISDAEDLLIVRNAISGALRVRGAEDVFLADADGVTVERVEDVFVEPDAVVSDRVEISDAHDLYVESEAVHGDLSVERPGHVHLADDPARRVREESVATYGVHEAVAAENVEEVFLRDDAVRGEVTVVDADELHEEGDDDGLLF